MDTNTGVIDTEATETGQEPYRLCLYTPDGILHTSEMENLTLQHIATQGKGNLLCQTADGIKKIITAINEEEASSGTLTITLKYSRGGDGAVKCTSKVKTSLPEKTDESLFFVTPQGGLSRSRQEDMHRRK